MKILLLVSKPSTLKHSFKYVNIGLFMANIHTYNSKKIRVVIKNSNDGCRVQVLCMNLSFR